MISIQNMWNRRNIGEKMCFTYDNISNLYSVLHINRPFLHVRTLDAYYYVNIRNLSSDKLGGMSISFIHEKKIDYLSMVYHRVSIDMSITDDEKILLISLQLVTMRCCYQNQEDMYILLLTYYHCITSLTLNGRSQIKI